MNQINNKEYVISELKKYPSNIDTFDPIEAGYNLSDNLKADPEIIKMILDSVYAIKFENKEYNLKELYMKYIDFYNSCLPDIYFKELDFDLILPPELKTDKDICNFINNNYINCEYKEDDEYNDAIIKMFNNCDIKINDTSNDKVYKAKSLYIKARNYMHSTKEYRQSAIDAFLEYLDYGISSEAIKYDIEYITEYADKYHISRCYRYIGDLYQKEKQFNDAIEYYDKAIEAFPYYHKPYIGKIDTLVKLDKIDEAIDYANIVINNQEIVKDNKIFKTISKINWDGRINSYNPKAFIKELTNKKEDLLNKKRNNYHYYPINNK